MDIKRLFSKKTEYYLSYVKFNELPINGYENSDTQILDSIDLNETQNDKIIYTIKRDISFEPKCIFDLSVELKVIKYFNEDVDINEIEKVDWKKLCLKKETFFSRRNGRYVFNNCFYYKTKCLPYLYNTTSIYHCRRFKRNKFINRTTKAYHSVGYFFMTTL